MSRHQLRAARALLLLRQESLADLAGVGVASIRRFENGVNIDRAVIAALRTAIETEGIILVSPGTVITGRAVGMGVVLRPAGELPASTRDRLAAVDATPEQAAAHLSPEQASKVGRRTRIVRGPDSGSERSGKITRRRGVDPA